MSVNRHLLLVVLGALVPLLVVSVLLAVVLVHEERRATERALQESARSIAQALDGEFERSFAALESLAQVGALQRDDLKGFYAEARALRERLGIWDNVLLLSPSAEHLLNLKRPYGSKLPPVPQPQGTLTAAATRAPFVSNALRGQVEDDWLAYIAYPVLRGGEVRYVISVTMSARAWTRWLAARTPEGMASGIVDGDHLILARTSEPEKAVGQPVQPWYSDVLVSSISGIARGPGVSSDDVVVAYHRSRVPGWYVNVVTPGAVLDAPIRRTATLVSLAVILALMIAVTLALRRGTVLTRGIVALKDALDALRRPVPRLPEADSEIREVREALEAAEQTARTLAARAERAAEAEASLRQSEARFRTISHAAPAIVWVSREQGIIFINERWHELTGQPAEQALGQGWTACVHPEDLERLAPVRERCSRTGEPYEGEIRYRNRQGEYRWHAFRALPSRRPDGTIEEWFGCSVDVHDARQAQEALREADRRKDEFIATLSHELRNPLAPIRNALYFLGRHAGDNPELRAAQDMMERQVRHMVRLIDDLLDVSRITRGRLQLRREPVTLERVVEQALETSRPHLSQRLTVKLPHAPVYLDADPVRLAQVLSNLLNNAAKYTPQTGHIRLSAAVEGGQAVIRVRDDGIGIAPEDVKNLFRIFSQATDALERSQGGLGIGLALARSLVGLHGGTIEAHSEGRGRGSEFVVRLPVLRAPDPAAAPPRPEPQYGGAVRRVLVVDDVEDNAESLAALLRLDGHTVETAADGLEAVRKAEAFKPDLVFMDLGLPKLDGMEACRLIRRQPWGRGIVLVAMTGWGQDEDRRRSAEAGFDAHLVKPVHYDAVRALLASPTMA